jgi:hypothetical protein
VVLDAAGDQRVEAHRLVGRPQARGVQGRELRDAQDVLAGARVEVGEAEGDPVGELGDDALGALGVELERSGRVLAVLEEHPRAGLDRQAAALGEASVGHRERHRLAQLLDPLLHEHAVAVDGDGHPVAAAAPLPLGDVDVGHVLDAQLDEARNLGGVDVGVDRAVLAEHLDVVGDPQLDRVVDGQQGERRLELGGREEQVAVGAAPLLGRAQAELARAVAEAEGGQPERGDGGDGRAAEPAPATQWAIGGALAHGPSPVTPRPPRPSGPEQRQHVSPPRSHVVNST